MPLDQRDASALEVIRRLKEAGIPPQDSNLIKPTINAVLGIEARSRTDYKITSDDEQQAEIAEGLSAKIKEVEAESRADRAMSDAYSSMIRAGVGWVEGDSSQRNLVGLDVEGAGSVGRALFTAR